MNASAPAGEFGCAAYLGAHGEGIGLDDRPVDVIGQRASDLAYSVKLRLDLLDGGEFIIERNGLEAQFLEKINGLLMPRQPVAAVAAGR